MHLLLAGLNGLAARASFSSESSTAASDSAKQVSEAVFTLDSLPLTVTKPADLSGAIDLYHTKLTPGGPDYIVGGNTVSAASNGVVVGTKTYPYSATLSDDNEAGVTQAVLVIGSLTFTATPATRGGVVIPSVTLYPGGPGTTMSNTPISAVSDALVIASSWTHALTLAETTAPSAVVTLDGQPLTVVETSMSDILINGAVLTPGGSAISLYGVGVSAASGGLAEGTTETVPLVKGSSTANLVTNAPSLGSALSTTSLSASSAMTGAATSMNATNGGATRRELGRGINWVVLFMTVYLAIL